MQPRTLSATALKTADLCLARFAAEHVQRSKGSSGIAANLGSAVHGALELYVQKCILTNEFEPSLKVLKDFFQMSFISLFKTVDLDSPEYRDGVEMLERWHARTDFSGVEVVSCEIKESFPIKTSAGEIPFNFIWDRHDKIDEDVYKVIDYKTNRWGYSPQDLRGLIQARAYGLAAQIKYPNAKEIWVEFDMLRHAGPVGTVFSRDDNISTWKWLKAKAEEILATPESSAPETLNPECHWCVRKFQCKAVRSNILVGGIMSAASGPEVVDLRAQLEWQKKAVTAAIEELDSRILQEARDLDVMEMESDHHMLSVAVSSSRAIDADRAAMILGPQLTRKYGSTSLTMGTVDKLLKGDELSPEQKKQLSGLIYSKTGEPRIKASRRNSLA